MSFCHEICNSHETLHSAVNIATTRQAMIRANQVSVGSFIGVVRIELREAVVACFIISTSAFTI